MDIIEKSKEYAKGKAIDALTAAIEQAYVDGYNDGLKHFENEKLESFVDGVEYVDLMLPSGTKWATDYLKEKSLVLRELSYVDASKFNLPTKEDFEELCRECVIENYLRKNNHGLRFIGKNGKIIELHYVRNDIDDDMLHECIFFWLKNDGEERDKIFARMSENKKIVNSKTFMGYKLPVLLVLKKNNSE